MVLVGCSPARLCSWIFPNLWIGAVIKGKRTQHCFFFSLSLLILTF